MRSSYRILEVSRTYRLLFFFLNAFWIFLAALRRLEVAAFFERHLPLERMYVQPDFLGIVVWMGEMWGLTEVG